MDDPQPEAGEVRIKIAASGINPGDVKKRENAFGYECLFRESVRTATARERLTLWAKVFPKIGLENVSGVTAHKLIDLLA